MVGLIIGVFAILWLWLFYQLFKAPEADAKGNIIEKDDNLFDYEEDDEFLN
jgi:hypothetical protein